MSLLFGLIIGSFVNVVIYRLPRNIDMVWKRSFCPHCKNLVPWYGNIPLLSYLFLLGKCRSCSKNISLRYPFIELIVGLASYFLYPSTYFHLGLANYAFYFSVFCVFVALFFIDVEHYILPNELNLYLFFLFLTYSIFFHSWKFWLLGGIVGFGAPALVTWIFYKLRNKIGLGGGDIKLYGVLGIFLGPIGVIHTIFLSCLLGSVIGLILLGFKIIKRNDPLPFGPAIILVGFLQIYFPKITFSLLSLLFGT